MSQIKYIDTHAHLNCSDYDSDIEAVIGRAYTQGVAVINVGTGIESSRRAVDIGRDYERIHPNLYAIVGIHPSEICDWFEEAMSAGIEIVQEEIHTAKEKIKNMLVDLEGLVGNEKVVGIGECGIDVFRIDNKHKDRIVDLQRFLFRGQIEIALRNNLPIMIHARESYKEILEVLDENFTSDKTKLRGNIHFFAGSPEEAELFLKRGFTVSFTGVITFASVYEHIVAKVPEGMFMSETDCPFVSPMPYRGKRNEPVYVIEVVKKMAQIRGISVEDMSKELLDTAKRVYDIKLD